MSLRFSIGSRWFELHLFTKLMAGAFLYLQFDYGHNSTNTLIRMLRSHNGSVMFRWRKGKVKFLRKAS